MKIIPTCGDQLDADGRVSTCHMECDHLGPHTDSTRCWITTSTPSTILHNPIIVQPNVHMDDEKLLRLAFGVVLKRRRGNIGLSQADLSSQVGIDQTYISRIENGRSTPDMFLANKLCRAILCDETEFLADVTAGLERAANMARMVIPSATLTTWGDEVIRVAGFDGLCGLIEFAVRAVGLQQMSKGPTDFGGGHEPH